MTPFHTFPRPMFDHKSRMNSLGCQPELMMRWSCPSNSPRGYFEMAQNLSLTYVIFPRGSVMATMECSSSAAFNSSISSSDISSFRSARISLAV
jgi:hypothetical protein